MKSSSTTALLLTASLLSGCESRAASPRDVLLVCVDTLRADHLGCYGYDRNPTSPNLDALAAESLVFLDASAASGWTKPSVPSYMTGTFPAEHGVYEGSSKDALGRISHVLPEEATTLAEVFRDRGYRTAAFVQNAQLRRGQGIEQGFELYVDRAGDAREIRWQSLDWLDELEEGEPFFLYLHLLDVHWPYPVPEEFATRFAPAEQVERFRTDDWKALRDAINDGEVEFGAEDRRVLEDLYDGAIRFADRELGRTFAGLRARNRWENTVVSVLSDHGEEFGEHGRIGHGHGLWENLLSVPWILRVPGRGPSRIENAVSLVDLFPTLLASAGLVAPSEHSGVDRLAAPEQERAIFAEHKAPDRYLQSLRKGAQKLVRGYRPEESAKEAGWRAGVGERWEAELARDGNGRLQATQLKPRDEEEDDPPELKGRVTSVSEVAVSIEGVGFLRTSETEVRGSEATTDLAPGVLAKVRYEWAGDERRATRIKLYPRDTKPAFEVRGTVEARVGSPASGAITIGGLTIRVDDSARVKGGNTRPRMSREDVHEFLVGRHQGHAGIRRDAWILHHGQEARATDDRTAALEVELERRGATFASRRYYGEADRSTLSLEDVQALEAIGYVE